MSTHEPDDATTELLRAALNDEASTVEASPGGLQAIQRRTSATSTSHKRRWVIGSLGAGLATAAVVTAIVMIAGNGGQTASPPIATQGTDDTAPQTTADVTSEPPSTDSPAPAAHPGVYDPNAPADEQFTMYYAGPNQPLSGTIATPVYPEVHTVVDPGADRALTAINEFLTSKPLDSSYTSLWPNTVSATSVADDGNVKVVALRGPDGAVPESIDGIFPGIERAPALLLLSAGIDGPARFTYNGTVMHGIDDADVFPSYTAPAYDTNKDRAPITVDISDGQVLSSPVTINVTGNAFEGNVIVRVYDANGAKIFDEPITTSQGFWTQVPVNIGKLDPGTYTIKAYEPSGFDGSPLFVDDKTFTVE